MMIPVCRFTRFLVLPIALALSGCGSGEEAPGAAELRVEGGWARATPGAPDEGFSFGSSAAYLTLVNSGRAGDRLLGGESPAASAVELHESVRDGEVMRMRPVEAVDLPPEGRVEFRPGGLHLMLAGLSRALEEGDTLEVVLRFERSGPMVVKLPVFRLGPETGSS